MSEQATEWTVECDDRFKLKLTCGDDTIELQRGPATDSREVVGYLGDQVYHTTHAHEAEAQRRVEVLKELATFEPEFEVAEEVYVVSDGFEPVVQRGIVLHNVEQHRSVEVHFESDPFDSESDEQRSIGCDPTEMLHVDADAAEVLSFVGRHDLLEPGDFA
jgi:hypothetical protein